MGQEKPLVIDTHALFNALNSNRKDKNLTIIEHSLMANKLGILFALKSGCYINFKNGSIKIQKSQWSILQEIFNQHFNVELFTEIQTLVTLPNHSSPKVATVPSQQRSMVPQVSLFATIKEFLERKIYSQPKQSTEDSSYMVDTAILLVTINHLRKNHHLGEIEELLIANKLGILFALKTRCYINFKQKFVELPNCYLTILQEVVEQHFNVVIDTETVISKQTFAKQISAHSTDLATSPRVKNFFKKRRDKITEMLEGIL